MPPFSSDTKSGTVYASGRKLNKELITRLANCDYITDYRNIFITGATGSGKNYMACAFGMEACKHYYNTKYVRLPDLLLDLKTAKENGAYKKVMAKYANPILLILDKWLLMKPTQDEQKDIFELLHRRRKKSSTIFCSQYRSDGYTIDIVPVDPCKDLSMREVYGLLILTIYNCKGSFYIRRWLTLVRISGSRHTGQTAPPQRNIHSIEIDLLCSPYCQYFPVYE